MTKIEMQYMEAVIEINRRQRNRDIDWEQRRYEIARDLYPTVVAQTPVGNATSAAPTAVFLAQLLINELKKVE